MKGKLKEKSNGVNISMDRNLNVTFSAAIAEQRGKSCPPALVIKWKKSETAHGTMDFVNELNQLNVDLMRSILMKNMLSLRAMLVDKCNDFNRVILSVDDAHTINFVGSGSDRISIKVVNLCSAQLAPIFTEIFQDTIDTGVIPVIWKTSAVTPVPKSRTVTTLNDYGGTHFYHNEMS